MGNLRYMRNKTYCYLSEIAGIVGIADALTQESVIDKIGLAIPFAILYVTGRHLNNNINQSDYNPNRNIERIVIK